MGPPRRTIKARLRRRLSPDPSSSISMLDFCLIYMRRSFSKRSFWQVPSTLGVSLVRAICILRIRRFFFGRMIYIYIWVKHASYASVRSLDCFTLSWGYNNRVRGRYSYYYNSRNKIILLFVGFPTKFCISHRFNFGNIMCVHTGYGYSSTSSVDDVPTRTRTLLLFLDPLLAWETSLIRTAWHATRISA